MTAQGIAAALEARPHGRDWLVKAGTPERRLYLMQCHIVQNYQVDDWDAAGALAAQALAILTSAQPVQLEFDL